MTVSSSVNKIIGSGNGVTTSWPFAFPVLDATHLMVLYTDAAGDESTLASSVYTVSLNADQAANPGGTVTYTPAIASGTKLTILREVPYTQATDIKNQGGFFPEVLERMGDLLAMQIQQIREQLARAFKLSPSQSAIGELEATDANRANTYVGFDNSGNLALYTGVASGAAVSVAMAPVVSAASLSAGRSAMAVPGLGDNNTFTGSNAFNGSVTFGNPGSPLASLLSWVRPGHRLSLTTALAVTVADVTAAGTVYWTPWLSNLSPIFDGALWRLMAIAEKSFILDTGNHLSGKNYDVMLDYNAGTPRLLTSPAWTTDTARADAIARDATYGWWTNSASMTCRISNNGGTVAKGAGTLLYLGTIRCAANGQTEDSGSGTPKRFVWNMYNRAPRAMVRIETTDSWSYNSTTTRQANASTANQLDMVRGLDEDAVDASVSVKWANNTVGESGIVQIGLDSTTTMATGCVATNPQAQVANLVMVSQAEWRGYPGIGYRSVKWLEKGTGAGGTQTWSGDGGSPTSFQSGITGWVMA